MRGDWRAWLGQLEKRRSIVVKFKDDMETFIPSCEDILTDDMPQMIEGLRLLSEALEADDAYLELLVANVARRDNPDPEFPQKEKKLRAEMMQTKKAAMAFLRGVGRV